MIIAYPACHPGIYLGHTRGDLARQPGAEKHFSVSSVGMPLLEEQLRIEVYILRLLAKKQRNEKLGPSQWNEMCLLSDISEGK